MTREETTMVMKIIDNESKGFMPIEKTDQTLKINTWHMMLKSYEFEFVQSATLRMLARFTYGTTPKIGDLFKILQPEKVKQDLGIEFADFVFKHYKKRGLETIQTLNGWEQVKTGKSGADLVAEKFGEQYVELFEDYAQEIKAAASEEELPFMKTRLAKRFNSENERVEHNKNYITNKEAVSLLGEIERRSK